MTKRKKVDYIKKHLRLINEELKFKNERLNAYKVEKEQYESIKRTD